MGTKKNPKSKKRDRLKDMPPKPKGGDAIKGGGNSPPTSAGSSGG
jgi:hypothetical protein